MCGLCEQSLLHQLQADVPGLDTRRRVHHNGVEQASPPHLQRVGEQALLHGGSGGERGHAAHRLGVPAYVIFHDATLREIAIERPRSLEALARVGGVGARKLESYGIMILTCLHETTA